MATESRRGRIQVCEKRIPKFYLIIQSWAGTGLPKGFEKPSRRQMSRTVWFSARATLIEMVGVVEEIRTFGVFEARVSEAEEEKEGNSWVERKFKGRGGRVGEEQRG